MKPKSATDGAAKNWLFKPVARLHPLDPEASRADLAEISSVAEEAGLSRLAAGLSGEGKVAAFLAAVFDLSDFMRDCARRRPEMLDVLFDRAVRWAFKALGAA